MRPLRFKEEDGREALQRADDKRQQAQGNVQEAGDRVQEKVARDVDRVGGNGRSEQLKEFIQTAGAHPEYDQGEPKVPQGVSAFTRRREIFTGRLAMLGFSAACFWEAVTPGHNNILDQITAFFNLVGFESASNTTSAVLLFGLIGWNAISALAPWSQTWTEENQKDVQKRQPGPTQGAADATHPMDFLGITGIGFTKHNELFLGRTAMMGFFAALVGQFVQGGLYGPGPLAQVANWFSIPVTDDYYNIFPGLAVAFVVGITAISYLSGRPGTLRGEKDVY